ncbi:hypothetical protein PsYK624_142490 [Phanerochaete sordida]|uniref:Uncharacterized protein n=1 Tax=Phanerochaete sordida TaxID=48140 RepID=A0A9P3GMD0_9APHY|nr:hypothetical protein PsYK624_142490 [Phanerochaete sordida]
MLFVHIFALLAAALAAPGSASPIKRQYNTVTQVDMVAYIDAPPAGTSMATGASTPFALANGWYADCYPVWTPLDIYVLADAPAPEGLNTTYGFSDYLAYIGRYQEINWNSPYVPPDSPPPPPTALMMPALDTAYVGADVYLTVVMNFTECAPDDHIDVGISYVTITYDG